MSTCAHGSLDGFLLVHAKLLQNIMSILHLAKKGPIFKLLDLKSKKELQLPNHWHLKPISHDLAKLVTKKLVSRAKYYVTDINLASE
jgi:hypothetical protein